MRLSGIVSRLGIQTTGYRSQGLTADMLLGSINALDYTLWILAFAALIFQGAIAAYMPLAITLLLLSTAALIGLIATTSKIPMSFAGPEEQAAIILGLVALVMNERFAEFHSPHAAAATMFAIMALSSVLMALSFYLSARFNLGRVIQVIPFPVLCGYLAGTGWLFVEAGISMNSGVDFDVGIGAALHSGADKAGIGFFFPHMYANEILVFDALIRWLPAFAAGAFIFVALQIREHWLVIPLTLIAVISIFYGIAWSHGAGIEQLRAEGWLFHVGSDADVSGLFTLDFGHIDWQFVVDMLPEMITMVAMTLLTTAVALSAMEAGTDITIDFNDELKSHAVANLGCALFLGMPGATEDAATIMAKRMGGSSRLLPLFACVLFIAAAFAGPAVISYVPKVVMGALVFYAALSLFYDYLIDACRRLSRADVATVWIVFGGVVLFDFVPALLIGLAITCIQFMVRYAQVSIVESTRLLADDPRTRVFNLQGYLFFGTVNSFFEQVKTILDGTDAGSRFIFNFDRVSGIDYTAAQTIGRIFRLLEGKQIALVCCGLKGETERTFEKAEVLAETSCTVVASAERA